jgi:hypothetical protein
MSAHIVFLLVIALIGLASGFESRLSVFACLLLVIGFASLSRFSHPRKRLIALLLGAAALSTSVGMLRFVWGEALPGIAEARGRATSKRAVSFLREILFAQDALRRYGMIDPDKDGVGSAARLGELAGSDGARGGQALATPPLSPRFSPRSASSSGPANQQEGYLLLICLPGRDSTWVTHPADPVDEEAAERRWVAYAWPAQNGLGHETAYFINEHEEILESTNREGAALRLVGPGKAPSCNDAINDETKVHGRVWNEKTKRPDLPGEKP